ncbi:hypothetical protein [Aquabacterium sp. NJ1]|uniref:hypothetical protein n=1 Tax=Aquabacterium sp. NJ1 TaxID=1538295 RepID=UPI001269F9F6|nr:hypothetical protein [Aquabacterium sp. NJ1]
MTFGYSLLLAVAFMEYFAKVVGDKLTFLAIDASAPLLQDLQEAFGKSTSHAVGHGVAFMVGCAGTFAFVLPCSLLPSHPLKRIASVLVMTVPVEVAMLYGGDAPNGIAGWAAALQPAAGAALAAITTLRIGRFRD